MAVQQWEEGLAPGAGEDDASAISALEASAQRLREALDKSRKASSELIESLGGALGGAESAGGAHSDEFQQDWVVTQTEKAAQIEQTAPPGPTPTAPLPPLSSPSRELAQPSHTEQLIEASAAIESPRQAVAAQDAARVGAMRQAKGAAAEDAAAVAVERVDCADEGFIHVSPSLVNDGAAGAAEGSNTSCLVVDGMVVRLA